MFQIVKPVRRKCGGLLVVLALVCLPLMADTTLVTNLPATTDTGDSWATGGSGESGNAVGFVNPFEVAPSLPPQTSLLNLHPEGERPLSGTRGEQSAPQFSWYRYE
jgi:hypothetical protein